MVHRNNALSFHERTSFQFLNFLLKEGAFAHFANLIFLIKVIFKKAFLTTVVKTIPFSEKVLMYILVITYTLKIEILNDNKKKIELKKLNLPKISQKFRPKYLLYPEILLE